MWLLQPELFLLEPQELSWREEERRAELLKQRNGMVKLQADQPELDMYTMPYARCRLPLMWPAGSLPAPGAD